MPVERFVESMMDEAKQTWTSPKCLQIHGQVLNVTINLEKNKYCPFVSLLQSPEFLFWPSVTMKTWVTLVDFKHT